MKNFPIFDIHTHTYPERIAEKACTNLGAFYEFIVQGKGTYADLESSAIPYHVKGFLLFSVATNAHQVPKVNDSIAELVKLSRSHGFETVGFAGMHQDYPDFAGAAAKAVAAGECERGIVLCTTGIGVSITANKVDGIRCALLSDVMSARMTREHNDTNMMALGAGVVGTMLALEIVDTWVGTEFSHQERHQRRIDKLMRYE